MNDKMNILQYIETSGPGGAETVLVNIARHMDRSRFNPYVVLHKSRWVHQQLEAIGVPTRIIPCGRSWDIGFLYRFVKTCRELKINVIHAHLFGAGLYASLAGVILRVPVIVTFHNELLLPGRRERFLRLKNFLIRHLASRLILVADFMKDDYVSRGKYPAGRLQTIYNGIECTSNETPSDVAVLRKELGLSESDLVVGHVANFRPPKGHRYLAEAAAKVCAEIPNAKFLLVGEFGDGSIKSEVEMLAGQFGIQDKLLMLGFRSDVGRLLNLIDVFVLSSISEGHPLSVVEAMAAGKPVVATNVGGLPEIVDQGETGYLVEPGDSSTLAEKLCLLLRNSDLRERMGHRSRELARRRFSLETMMTGYEKLYQEASR
ncbi:MAG: glycosyltransferase [Candidatus Zixiibacteriota bacterium]|nr:MAG: glycosyltransferase [candidate division Zixibacteria bacterium]